MFDISRFASSLSLGADGIWYGAAHVPVSYPPDGHQACFQLEESSFWFRHRNACIAAAVQNFPPRNHGPIFDIGGGNGFVSLGLIQAGFETVLVEPGPDGASNAKRRGVQHVICASSDAAGFAPASLDAVGLFDVIEHIPNDLPFLESMRRLLPEGGRLYATVPAYAALWSAEDDSAGHFRRYTLPSITAVMTKAGFSVEYATYIFRPLPLPILVLRALPYRLGLKQAGPTDQRRAARDHTAPAGAAASVFGRVLQREVRNVEQKRRMHFGGSCLLVANAI